MATDATARIKNLSIALEALSRIAGNTVHYSIEELLETEVQSYRKEQIEREHPLKVAPARPAISTPDDDIPF